MCTMSWWQEGPDFHLLFNRDELQSRKPARPPQYSQRDGQQLLAPVDADAGGTWLGAGSAGFLLCLLNYYPPHNSPGSLSYLGSPEVSFRSRGELIPLLLANPQLLQSPLADRNLSCYRPFSLISFDLRRAIVQTQGIRWDGKMLHNLPSAPGVLSSSSCFSQEVETARLAYFDRLEKDPGEGQKEDDTLSRHLRYHTSHGPELRRTVKDTHPDADSPNANSSGGNAASVCMHRGPDVAGPKLAGTTVSLSHVTARDRRFLFQYFAGSPCRGFTKDLERQNPQNWFTEGLDF
ncbi:NRDE family protein [Candidatus Haliotispira prima]|uniref:NRDE family protein n=1 Tax=Candidatus Haliotispira prima TaxID=3034016 RepID=A0ABY8MEH7_9SPIO|nr:NRDE family protein [Candidatus Haliotispira prima]